MLDSNTILKQKKPGSLDKWLILGLGQDIVEKMIVKNPVLSESKEVLKYKRMGVCHRSQPKTAPNGQS